MGYASVTHQPNVRRRAGGEFLPVATRVMWALIIATGLLTLLFTFYPEWSRLTSMKMDLLSQQRQLDGLKKKNSECEREVHLLQTDPQYLEIIAREKLDLMKEGETIFRLGTPRTRS